MSLLDSFSEGFTEALKHVNITPNQAIKVAAVLAAAQGVSLAVYLLNISKVQNETEKQFMFLADIVTRNVEHLEEFDLIALRELGMLEEL